MESLDAAISGSGASSPPNWMPARAHIRASSSCASAARCDSCASAARCAKRVSRASFRGLKEHVCLYT